MSSHSYPPSHTGRETTPQLPSNLAFLHHLYPSLNHPHPFLLIQTTPTLLNSHQLNNVNHKPIPHLSPIQAIPHPSHSLLYFHSTQAPGPSQKFHPPLLHHSPHQHTPLFQQ
ncbi:beta-galactosidase, partial [Bacillus altitudinis]|uniref:beta-galactosidase n=1 Tax=Bacillus altitudinis TaxID=293387 RepID=UPI003B520582